MVKLFKVAAVLFYVLGFPAGLISCRAQLNTADATFLTLASSVILTWLVAALFGTLFLALSRALERLEIQESQLGESQTAIEELKAELKALRNTVYGNAELAAAKAPVRTILWQCKKCKASNPSTELSCRQCGTYR